MGAWSSLVRLSISWVTNPITFTNDTHLCVFLLSKNYDTLAAVTSYKPDPKNSIRSVLLAANALNLSLDTSIT